MSDKTDAIATPINMEEFALMVDNQLWVGESTSPLQELCDKDEILRGVYAERSERAQNDRNVGWVGNPPQDKDGGGLHFVKSALQFLN